MTKRARPLEPKDLELVVGVRGTGKSYYTAMRRVPCERRIVIFDPHGEYSDPDEYDVAERITLYELAGDPALLAEPAFKYSVVPDWHRGDIGERWDLLAEEFGAFVDMLEAMTQPCVAVVEEVGMLAEAGATKALKYMATQSRHWGGGVAVVLVAQRAMQIPKTAREQASHIVSAQQTDPEDIEAIRKRIGSAADRIAKLNPCEYVTWCKDSKKKPETTKAKRK